MLRITITETGAEIRWTLSGTLVGPWVGELRKCWKERHRSQSGRKDVVDLNNVTFFDGSGQRLLRAMCKTGTEFIASGIYTRHVLEKAKARR